MPPPGPNHGHLIQPCGGNPPIASSCASAGNTAKSKGTGKSNQTTAENLRQRKAANTCRASHQKRHWSGGPPCPSPLRNATTISTTIHEKADADEPDVASEIEVHDMPGPHFPENMLIATTRHPHKHQPTRLSKCCAQRSNSATNSNKINKRFGRANRLLK